MKLFAPFLSIMLLLTCLASHSTAVAAESFITNLADKDVTFSKDDISNILLGRKTTWPNGSRITLIALDDDSNVSANVFKEYVRKSPPQYFAFWKRQVFTGKGSMPKIAKNEDEMITLIASTPGALGFVDSSKVTDTVAVVTVR